MEVFKYILLQNNLLGTLCMITIDLKDFLLSNTLFFLYSQLLLVQVGQIVLYQIGPLLQDKCTKRIESVWKWLSRPFVRSDCRLLVESGTCLSLSSPFSETVKPQGATTSFITYQVCASPVPVTSPCLFLIPCFFFQNYWRSVCLSDWLIAFFILSVM